MLLKPRRRLFGAALVFGLGFGLLASSCGARTGIYTSDAGVEEPVVCEVDLDCATGDACAPAACLEGTCVPLRVAVCNDGNECTADNCDPSSGQCFFEPITLDLDGDGHRSPRPGFAPGAPEACGDDCDDRSAAAHPGGAEACDGVDNDCNGKVDDNAVYGQVSQVVRVSSGAFDRANGAGLAFDGTSYGVTFSGHQQLWSSYFEGLARNGSTTVAETSLADVNSETYAGPLIHNGSYFASAWADARQDGNYEVYFNRFDSTGKKLGPDLRVTRARDFSLNPALAWNGTESLLIWDDRRFEERDDDDARVFGQRIGFDGRPLGDNVQLTPRGIQGEGPALAVGRERVGIVFTSIDGPNGVHAKFLHTAPDLSSPSAVIDLGGRDVENTQIAAVNGRFITAWQRHGATYGPAIFAAVVNETGTVLVPELPITFDANFARSFSLLSLGDRLLVVWVDDHDGNYEVYQQILDENLNVLSPRTRLTFTPSDTLSPVTALGPNGDLGVLYDDWATGDRQSYFLSMSCAMAGGTLP